MSTIKSVLKRKVALVAIVSALSAATASVYQFGHADAEDLAPVATALPTVSVVNVKPQLIRQWKNFSGRLTAVDYVEVRPLVGGTITRVDFEDGDTVKAGDLLFVIDPRPFAAAVERAEANLESARSQVELAGAQLKRAAELVKGEFVSESVYDQRQKDFEVATAAVRSAEAELRFTKLDLEHSHVRAPVSGVVSRAEITLGNVIESGPSAPILTTVVSIDELYAEFDVDERTFIQAKRQLATGDNMPVLLTLAGDKVVYSGELYSFDNQLDLGSGTIRARATIKNSDGALTPGMFASVSLGAAQETEALVISEKAIGTDQDKKFALTVGDDNRVAYKELSLGETVSGGRIVKSGLSAGDRVIVGGLHWVRPNIEVAIKGVATAPKTVQLATVR
jgi:multidrug efflux system membrane fusion protein